MDRWVALRKESVDRNHAMQVIVIVMDTSLSARRAWIEIIKKGRARRPGQVALRKESVDRNNSLESKQIDPSVVALRKESVDRNRLKNVQFCSQSVALRKESVDRNPDAARLTNTATRRSPQGERG